VSPGICDQASVQSDADCNSQLLKCGACFASARITLSLTSRLMEFKRHLRGAQEKRLITESIINLFSSGSPHRLHRMRDWGLLKVDLSAPDASWIRGEGVSERGSPSPHSERHYPACAWIPVAMVSRRSVSSREAAQSELRLLWLAYRPWPTRVYLWRPLDPGTDRRGCCHLANVVLAR